MATSAVASINKVEHEAAIKELKGFVTEMGEIEVVSLINSALNAREQRKKYTNSPEAKVKAKDRRVKNKAMWDAFKKTPEFAKIQKAVG